MESELRSLGIGSRIFLFLGSTDLEWSIMIQWVYSKHNDGLFGMWDFHTYAWISLYDCWLGGKDLDSQKKKLKKKKWKRNAAQNPKGDGARL